MQPMGAGGDASVPPYTPGMKTQTLGLDYNIAALVGYVVGIIAIIIAVTEPQEPQRRWVRFHAWQAIGLIAGYLVLAIVGGILGAILGTGIISTLFQLGFFVVMVLNAIKAHKGEYMNLGPITKFAASKA